MVVLPSCEIKLAYMSIVTINLYYDLRKISKNLLSMISHYFRPHYWQIIIKSYSF